MPHHLPLLLPAHISVFVPPGTCPLPDSDHPLFACTSRLTPFHHLPTPCLAPPSPPASTYPESWLWVWPLYSLGQWLLQWQQFWPQSCSGIRAGTGAGADITATTAIDVGVCILGSSRAGAICQGKWQQRGGVGGRWQRCQGAGRMAQGRVSNCKQKLGQELQLQPPVPTMYSNPRQGVPPRPCWMGWRGISTWFWVNMIFFLNES